MQNINHEYYVSNEVAKLLKEAGFDWEEHYPRNFCYVNDNTELFDKSVLKNYIGEDDVIYLAPTLDVAQRWLREEKNLILLIDITPSYCNGKPMGYKFVIHVSCGNHILGEWKDTYEEAQEAGIKKALGIILEKGE